MRILHCIHSVNPASGGPIEGIKRLNQALPRFGHSSEIATLDDPRASFVNSCPMKVYPLGPAFLKYGYSSKWVPWLKNHTKEYDLIVVNGLWQFVGIGAWSATRFTKKPYVVFPHGMLDPWFKYTYPLKHLKKWLYWPLAEYRVLRDAAAVIFTTQEERLLARKSFWLYKAREAVVSYGTADPAPISPSAPAAFLAKFPHLRDRPFLLFLGRIHPKKGCDLLIHALHRLQNELPEHFHLVIAGPDAVDWRPHLIRLAERLGVSHRVSWAGLLEGELKWGAFATADAFVLCSHQENFGIAVAEALACELPVLISDKVNIWRDIADRHAGYVAADTIEGATQLLSRWVRASADEKYQLRRNARKLFLDRFEIAGTVRSFLEIVQEFVPAA